MARHYARRSLRIEVTCNHCAKRLAFFNKCSLLLHAREHKERGLIMQCSHLVMKPVPVEQMISQQEPAAVGWLKSFLLFLMLLFFMCDHVVHCVFLLDSSGGLSPSLPSSSSAPSSSFSGQATPQPTPQLHKATSNKKAEAGQHMSKCPECQAQFSSKEELAEHFQEIKPAQTAVSL